jgi:hypothetical protein
MNARTGGLAAESMEMGVVLRVLLLLLACIIVIVSRRPCLQPSRGRSKDGWVPAKRRRGGDNLRSAEAIGGEGQKGRDID